MPKPTEWTQKKEWDGSPLKSNPYYNVNYTTAFRLLQPLFHGKNIEIGISQPKFGVIKRGQALWGPVIKQYVV